MNIKKISPENIIKLSASISLILVERCDNEELTVIKNILFTVANNISGYQGQYNIIRNQK